MTEAAIQTAYSKHKSRRKIYGSHDDEEKKNDKPLAISEFIETEVHSSTLQSTCMKKGSLFEPEENFSDGDTIERADIDEKGTSNSDQDDSSSVQTDSSKDLNENSEHSSTHLPKSKEICSDKINGNKGNFPKLESSKPARDDESSAVDYEITNEPTMREKLQEDEGLCNIGEKEQDEESYSKVEPSDQPRISSGDSTGSFNDDEPTTIASTTEVVEDSEAVKESLETSDQDNETKETPYIPQPNASDSEDDDDVTSTKEDAKVLVENNEVDISCEGNERNQDFTEDPVEAMTQTTDEQPDSDSLIVSIDNLFVHADKENVTVKDIVQALEEEYQVKLAKKTKNFVRERLKDLVKGEIKPNAVDEPADDDETEAPSESDNDGSGDEFEDGDDESSDYEEMKSMKKKARKSRKGVTKGKQALQKTRKSTRRVAKERKPSARQIIRKNFMEKRMEELRVRQEELQIKISKEDQERADQISARFNTDTDELRLKRLEDRLDLLQKLDLKRVQVIAGFTPSHTKNEIIPPTVTTSDSESDSDMELEIIKAKDDIEKPKEPDFPIESHHEHKQSAQSKALAILSQFDNKGTQSKKTSSPKRVSWSDSRVKVQASPGESRSARAALRATLLSKQRKMGNMWLARELGYKNEQDHLRDCLQIEADKRTLVIKKEEERIKFNERKQIRERLLLEQEDEDNDEDIKNETENEETTEIEEDEELALAREIQNEKQVLSTVPEFSEKSDCDEEEVQNGLGERIEQTDEMADDEKTVAFSCCDADTAVEEDDDKTVAFSCVGDGDADNDDYDDKTPALPLIIETGSSLSNSLVACDDMVNVPSMSAEMKMPQLESANELKDSTEENTEEDSSSLSNNKLTPEQVSDKADASNDSVKNVREETEGSLNNDVTEQEEGIKQSKKEKNSAWKAMLQKEAEKAKKLKKRQGGSLVEAEADEEEEEDVVAGLEDFGFALEKRKKESENDEEEEADKLDDEDLKHVVDELSDDEGDEEEGDRARKELMKREEKEHHKEILRRMRDGYDGRRGGIASGGAGARGMHRFDQLVAADNRQDAKRLGLLNDDEIDSDNENESDSESKGKDTDEVEDETMLLDKILKDRFLHRSSVELEENFSDDEDDEDEEKEGHTNREQDKEQEEERLIAQRFAKRARMQRLIETHGEDKEFSQLRLLDEDDRMKKELTEMKDVVGKYRRQSSLTHSSQSRSSFSNSGGESQNGTTARTNLQSSGATQSSSLFVAVQASRQRKKTSFLGGSAANKETVSAVHKSVALNHVVFHKDNSQSKLGGTTCSQPSTSFKRKRKMVGSTSLWEKVSSNSFRKKNRRG
mmetsp:Transcript_23085/g.34080  ORF Transcript_23085/g.34080 Transcript_23085/m.34080 type:complete len:1330 (+) Transcript_23085:111-4100(+)